MAVIIREPLQAVRVPPKRTLVRVLDADPELGSAISLEAWPRAVTAAVAPVFRHHVGPWRFFPKPDRVSFGALILDGVITVRVQVDGHAHLELLGDGDVISPWAGAGPDMALPTEVTASVVKDLRLAVLDRTFARRIAEWPEIHAALIQRLIARSRRLSLQGAINSLPRVEERVELTLWQLAYRFGRVTPAGTLLQLRLTHHQLSEIVAARRPSVSVALARLAAAGRVRRSNGDEWLLTGAAPSKLAPLQRQTGLRT